MASICFSGIGLVEDLLGKVCDPSDVTWPLRCEKIVDLFLSWGLADNRTVEEMPNASEWHLIISIQCYETTTHSLLWFQTLKI